MVMLAQLRRPTGDLFFELRYDRKRPCFYASWFGFCTDVQIVQGGAVEVEWAERIARVKGAKLIINDTRRMVGSWESSIAWAAEEWAPRMHTAGMRLNAILLPNEIGAKASGEAFSDSTGEGSIVSQVFESMAEIDSWISTHPEMTALNTR